MTPLRSDLQVLLTAAPLYTRRASRRPRRAACLLVAVAGLGVAWVGGFAPTPLSVTPASAAVAAAAADDEDEQVPPQVAAAVDKALLWLSKQQQGDGTWPQGPGASTAVPALAVKAFLARGHVPGQGPYGQVINHGIDYVLAQQQADGMLSSANGNAGMYEHGISAAMLGEAFGMVDDARKNKIDKALAKATKMSLDAQAVRKDAIHQGGWRYQRTSPDSDISVTGWQLMALRAAANCGAYVPKGALESGREYVRRCSFKGGPGFTYQAQQGTPGPARTGTAIVSLEMLGEHHSKEAMAGGDYLLENPVTNPNEGFYYYSVYYIAQAYYHLGDKYYRDGYPKLRDALLASQGPEGTWPVGSGQEQVAGEAYRTSMAVLALSVPYRYLPLFQK
jgi:hypothetical protein